MTRGYFEPREADLGTLAAACIESGETCVLLDADVLPGTFFDLSTRVAGELLHELGKYGLRLAVVLPDPTRHSGAFQDFVRESNRGRSVRFFVRRADAVAWLRGIVLRRITAQDADVYRSIRLRALQDAPTAFGSTYARESGFSEEEWNTRAARADGRDAIGFLALRGGEPCGLVGGFPGRDDPQVVTLVSMWVAPAHRRLGIGRMLVEGVLDWATHRGAHTVRLMVTSDNSAGARFYEALGFAPTGRREPHPHVAGSEELEMVRRVDPGLARSTQG